MLLNKQKMGGPSVSETARMASLLQRVKGVSVLGSPKKVIIIL